MSRIAALAGVALVALFASACGSDQSKLSRAGAADSERSSGFSADDQSRCEWKGRRDREISETTATGSLHPNIRRVYQIIGEGSSVRKVLICREVDTNLDGIKDVVRVFNEKGEAMREEADTNYDGKVNSWMTFANGRMAKHVLDENGDGRPDKWKYYASGKLSRIQRDTNGDGEPDVWEIYRAGRLERMGVDVDFDGRVDRWDRDEMARVAEAKEAEAKNAKNNSQPADDAGAPDSGTDATTTSPE